MLIQATKPLFPWYELDLSPTRGTIEEALRTIPDSQRLAALNQRRHDGCGTDPVSVLWGVLLPSITPRHTTTEACPEELRRNAPSRRLTGIGSEDAVPGGRNITRFLAVLGHTPYLDRLRDTFDHRVQRLGAAVPDRGRHTAADSTGRCGRREPDAPSVKAGIEDGLPQARGGRKEYKDDDGKVTKVVEWSGYKSHRLVSVKHEVVLGYHLSDTTRGDNECAGTRADQAPQNVPAERIEARAYDEAADDGKVHDVLHGAGIKPLIRSRAMWPKGGEQDKVIGGRVPLHVVHDEAGRAYCYDTVSQIPARRAMSDAGHEKGRGTLKYRGPAQVEGFRCAREEMQRGYVVWDDGARAATDRIATITADHASDLQFRPLVQWPRERGRVNDRLKAWWGLDDGNAVGSRRFCAHVVAVLIAHLAFATLLAEAQRQ